MIIGCARLTTSGRRIELSAHRERIGGDEHVCINSAYRGRGEIGFYIPSVCPEDPVGRRPAVMNAVDGRYGAKDWGVRGYEYVVWGTGDVSTSAITLRHRGGEAAAALFRIDQRLASTLGATRPFIVFIAELPSLSACEPVSIAAEGGLLAEAEPLPRQPKECTELTRRWRRLAVGLAPALDDTRETPRVPRLHHGPSEQPPGRRTPTAGLGDHGLDVADLPLDRRDSHPNSRV